MQKRRLTSTKGDTVETFLSDGEALAILQTLKHNQFAQDLYWKSQQYTLSENQLVWVHKIALENLTPTRKEVGSAELIIIVEMLRSASKRLKAPKIRLLAAGGKEIKLYIAGERSKYPGTVQVVSADSEDGGNWYGRITPIASGAQFVKGRNCPPWVEALIDRFATDPVGIAAEYGRLTGRCCFCYQQLTDERSTQVGYGPICAQHYGLPWGETEQKADGEEPTPKDFYSYFEEYVEEGYSVEEAEELAWKMVQGTPQYREWEKSLAHRPSQPKPESFKDDDIPF